MPKGLVRFQNCGVFHFITFSCYRREALLAQRSGYIIFEEALERVRQSHRFVVAGYVLMPEHVHLLVNEPQKGSLATVLQVLKQTTSKKLKRSEEQQFWQRRYYDFNVWTDEKRIEKLRYMHLNPVRRSLTAKPEDWPWSSFGHYSTRIEGTVEVESFWTAHKRERSTGRPDKILPSHP